MEEILSFKQELQKLTMNANGEWEAFKEQCKAKCKKAADNGEYEALLAYYNHNPEWVQRFAREYGLQYIFNAGECENQVGVCWK